MLDCPLDPGNGDGGMVMSISDWINLDRESQLIVDQGGFEFPSILEMEDSH
jgi:hypothetical protein